LRGNRVLETVFVFCLATMILRGQVVNASMVPTRTPLSSKARVWQPGETAASMLPRYVAGTGMAALVPAVTESSQGGEPPPCAWMSDRAVVAACRAVQTFWTQQGDFGQNSCDDRSPSPRPLDDQCDWMRDPAVISACKAVQRQFAGLYDGSSPWPRSVHTQTPKVECTEEASKASMKVQVYNEASKAIVKVQAYNKEEEEAEDTDQQLVIKEEVPVKRTFIHYDVPNFSVTKSMLEDGGPQRWSSAPGVLLDGDFKLKEPAPPVSVLTMEEAHTRGVCRPCAYFLYKVDGCRGGNECEFCHLCPQGEHTKRKKEKTRAMRAARSQIPSQHLDVAA